MSRPTQQTQHRLAREKRAKQLAARKQTLRRQARKLLNDTLRRLTHEAYRRVLGIEPAYKPGQSPEERRTRRIYRKLSKRKSCGDAVAQAHAKPTKKFREGKGVGWVKRRGRLTK